MKAKEKLENANWHVRKNAASNPNTSAETLAELAKDKDWYVRSNAACNPNMPKKQLKIKI